MRGGEQGLFVHEARVLSALRYLVSGIEPRPTGVSAITACESLAYYVTLPPGRRSNTPDRGSGLLTEDTQHTLELTIHRRLEPASDPPSRQTTGAVDTDGIDEHLTLTNYSNQATAFDLSLIVDADFLSLPELRSQPLNLGSIHRSWDATERRLTFEWHGRNAFDHGREHGGADDRRSIVIDVRAADGPVDVTPNGLTFAIALEPGQRWTAQLRFTPFVMHPPLALNEPHGGARRSGQRFEFPGDHDRTAAVSEILHRSQADLLDLRLSDLDRGPHAWTMAAGIPIYVALFGRDTLTASWQAALLTPDMMRGSLQILADMQGQTNNDWRDESPGRLLHEAHTGPLEVLNVNPRARYYGSVTTSGFFPLVLAQYLALDRRRRVRAVDVAACVRRAALVRRIRRPRW